VEPVLSVNNLKKQYGKTTALNGVSVQLERGRVLAVIGANGAGKTTLIKCIVGLIRYTGEIRLAGVDVARDARAARRLIGYLPQSSAILPDFTVEEAAIFYADLKGVGSARARTAVESAGLSEHGSKRVSELSGGMNQRLGLALALLADPPLVILDEPTAGLDVAARLDLRRLIQEQRNAGKSVILSTHWLEDVPYIADEALLLDRGETVYWGPAQALAANQAAASRVFLRLNGRMPDAIPLVRSFASTRAVDQSGDWLVVSCPAGDKARIVQSLVAAGITILDFRVEEASVGDTVARMRHAQEAQP
jgi:ABC-type multidrug transport system ATPase subunit